MKQIEQFFTKDSANKGIQIPLETPDGKKTEFYLTIRSVDSDAFQIEKSKVSAEAVGLMEITDEAKIYEESRKLDVQLLSSLVAGWNFTNDDGSPYPCTKENITQFLTNAPQIADKINSLATQRTLFMQGGLEKSPTTQKKSSPSKNKSKVAPKQRKKR